MLGYITKRLLLSAFTVWAISVLAFFIIELPEGNLAEKRFQRTVHVVGESESMAKDLMDKYIKYLNLDKPIWYRYGNWMWRMLRHGDLGLAFGAQGGGLVYQEPVKEIVGERIWTNIALTGFTIIVTWTFAIPVGIYSAVRQHSVGDYVFTLVGFTGLAVPDFLLGLVLMYLFFAYFDMNVGGLFSANYINAPWSLGKVADLIDHLWIPAVVLGTSGTAGLIRVMRNNLLDELSKPYVITARSKGVPPIRLILKYPVRVAINPLISTVGYLLPALVSGSVIVSVVLSLPTIGPILLVAIWDEDIYLAGFIVLLLGLLTVIGTFISDILLAVVDPRVKLND